MVSFIHTLSSKERHIQQPVFRSSAQAFGHFTQPFSGIGSAHSGNLQHSAFAVQCKLPQHFMFTVWFLEKLLLWFLSSYLFITQSCQNMKPKVCWQSSRVHQLKSCWHLWKCAVMSPVTAQTDYLWVLQFPPTLQTHAGQMNWKQWVWLLCLCVKHFRLPE